MSYNWTSAATPQGRERLFQILKECGHVGLRRLDLNLFDFIRRTENRFGTQMFCGLIDLEDNIHGYEIDEYITEHGNNLLFLDPSPTQPKADKTHDQLGFGDYVCIEQFRYGVPHEFFQYKVVGTLRSNCWVDTPIKHTPTAVRHDSMDDVILCICCGIDETKVDRFRLSDVVPHGRYWELNRRAGKESNT